MRLVRGPCVILDTAKELLRRLPSRALAGEQTRERLVAGGAANRGIGS
jgi:hypothetical protein